MVNFVFASICYPVICSHLICALWLIFRKKSRFGLYTLGTVLLAGGGALIYAKYDNDFRKQVVEYVPYVDDGIKLIFQEEKTIADSVST